MKKLSLCLFLLLGITVVANISSCRKVQSKDENRETVVTEKNKPEVKKFIVEFIHRINNNIKDSVSYPDISKGNSFVSLSTDSIKIFEGTDGKYVVYLNDGISLKLNCEPDGKLSIIESQGLFKFPEEKVNIAKKTGMWDDTLTDAALADRIEDDTYFKYLENQIKKKTSNIITVTKKNNDLPELGTEYGDIINFFINNTDQPIKSTDYSIIKKYHVWGPPLNEYDDGWESGTEVLQGIPIPPHGKVSIMTYMSPMDGGDWIEGIKIKLSTKQLQERFAPFTGNEYQEYLSTKSSIQ